MKQLIAITLFLVACHQNNPNAQIDAPGSGADGGIDALIDGPGGCQSNTACNGNTPICQLSDHTCVACATDSDCTGIGSAHTCLPSGACAGDADISYVTGSGSDAGTCSFESPCQTVGYALTNTSSATIVLTGTANDDGVTIDRDVTLLGRGSAELTRSTGGPAVAITGTSAVSIYDVMIDGGASTGSGNGITSSTSGNVSLYDVTVSNNQGSGINWTGTGNLTLTQSQVSDSTGTNSGGINWASAGTLTLDRSTVSGTKGIGISASAGTVDISRSLVGSNAGGGLSLTATGFHIENAIIANNGGAATNFGGVLLNTSPSTSDTILFSTIASNRSSAGAGIGGISCAAQVNAVTFSDNIIANNEGLVQLIGTACSYTYTDFYPTGFLAGSGNGSGDPGLTSDFHLDGSGSAVIDTASSTGAPTIDYFGTSRPQGPGYDMGAAEYMP